MENEKQIALKRFSDALLCSPEVYTWHYSSEGILLDTNSPEHVYHRIFEHTECLSYMLEAGREDSSPVVLSAKLGILWGAVFEWEEDQLSSCYVIGPVFDDKLDSDLLTDAIGYYHFDDTDWRPIFIRIMRSIPSVSSMLFLQYVVLMHFMVNGERIHRSDIRFQSREAGPQKKSQARKSRYQTYLAEQGLLQMIREGNIDYQNALNKASQLSSGVGITTDNPVRRAILSASNFTALCTRAAIEGGLTPDTAYTIGDGYLQSLTECKTIAQVREVNHAMYDEFVIRVRKEKQRPGFTRQIKNCVAYVEAHPEEELTLEGLAREVGYSPYHLSRKFKEESGLNLRDYIRNVRIERAKLLLGTTDLTIRDIAEQLHFSGSSHFARIFKEQTGMLPGEYRNQNLK